VQVPNSRAARKAEVTNPVVRRYDGLDLTSGVKSEIDAGLVLRKRLTITGSTLRDRSQAAEYDYWIVGENLAAGQRTPVEVVSAWMTSPCHRENVLNPAFTELGVAVRYGGTYGYYWVQEFGRPFSAPAYPGPPHHDPGCTHED